MSVYALRKIIISSGMLGLVVGVISGVAITAAFILSQIKSADQSPVLPAVVCAGLFVTFFFLFWRYVTSQVLPEFEKRQSEVK